MVGFSGTVSVFPTKCFGTENYLGFGLGIKTREIMLTYSFLLSTFLVEKQYTNDDCQVYQVNYTWMNDDKYFKYVYIFIFPC